MIEKSWILKHKFRKLFSRLNTHAMATTGTTFQIWFMQIFILEDYHHTLLILYIIYYMFWKIGIYIKEESLKYIWDNYSVITSSLVVYFDREILKPVWLKTIGNFLEKPLIIIFHQKIKTYDVSQAQFYWTESKTRLKIRKYFWKVLLCIQ